MTTRYDHQPLRFEIQSEENKAACLKAAQDKRDRRANKEPLSGLTWEQIEARRTAHFAAKHSNN